MKTAVATAVLALSVACIALVSLYSSYGEQGGEDELEQFELLRTPESAQELHYTWCNELKMPHWKWRQYSADTNVWGGAKPFKYKWHGVKGWFKVPKTQYGLACPNSGGGKGKGGGHRNKPYYKHGPAGTLVLVY